MENLAPALRAAAIAVAELGACAVDIASLDDAALLAAQVNVSAYRRYGDVYAAWIASEIARRSRFELGHDGLAQRRGFVSPEALIQSVSKTTRAEAAKLVQVGTMMAENEAASAMPVPEDRAESTDRSGSGVADECAESSAISSGVVWQKPIADAIASGTLSTDSAESIRKALGTIDDAVTGELLRQASELLVAEAAVLNADQLFRRARQVRDRLDADGIERREKERRDLRYLKTWQQPDGMYRGSWLLDPENGRMVAAAFETILSPRRGGPRFVDQESVAKAQALLKDPRTTEQIAADALVDMIRLAAAADPGTLFGRHRPAVRIVVTERDLSARTGYGHIEGHPDPVSIETVERLICDTGGVPVGFDDDGQCINVGRTQRLFTERQRVGLAVRDGGCRFPDCERPPSYCEAHHIDQWHRNHGKTDLADGILLCRRHHMILHNNHWDIVRRDGSYWLRPPKSLDIAQELLELPSKNAMMWVAGAAVGQKLKMADRTTS